MNKNTAQGACKNIKKSIVFLTKIVQKLDRKLSKIGFVTPKIVVNGNKLTKIVTINFFLNKNTAQGACKNIKKSIVIFCNAHKGNSLPGEHSKIYI